MVLVIVAAIFVVLVAVAIIKTLLWLALIALIVLAAGVALGAAFRVGRRTSRRYSGGRR